MAGRGGYQAPAKPAPASNPGAGSRRTDGGTAQKLRDLPNPDYGEGQEFLGLQRAAPLAQTPAQPSPPAPGSRGGAVAPQGNDLSQAAIPLSAPTQRPNEPVTAGAAAGPGPGPEALNLPNSMQQAQQTTQQFIEALAATSSNPAVQYLAAAVRGSL